MFKIYYLDDEIEICEIFTEYFSSDTIEVSTFTESDEAVKQCEAVPPDLLFIDFRLRGKAGDAVAMVVDDKIPKVLVTGEIGVQSKFKFQHILKKPYNFDEVKELIDLYRRNPCRR